LEKPLEVYFEGSQALRFVAMPEVAKALRSKKQSILQTWQEIVKKELPNAQDLTINEVRDSIPLILDRLVEALASDKNTTTKILVDVTGIHGEERFNENYNFEELLIEYQILREVVLHEVGVALGGNISTAQVAALSAGIDIVVHQGTSTFIKFLSTRLRDAAEKEVKFLAFLSHDLRNGLTSILSALNLTSRKLMTHPDLGEEIQWIESAKLSISKTVKGMERMLSAERLRKQPTQPKFEPVDLTSLVSRIMDTFKSEANLKNLRLEILIPPNTTVHTDEEIISIALVNLIGNAIKYSSKGAIKIGTDLPSNSKKWKIYVSDQGYGIPAEQLEIIFNAFCRGDAYGQDGIGLGLTIATQAAKLLKGSITVESKQNIGSTFTLNFDNGGS